MSQGDKMIEARTQCQLGSTIAGIGKRQAAMFQEVLAGQLET